MILKYEGGKRATKQRGERREQRLHTRCKSTGVKGLSLEEALSHTGKMRSLEKQRSQIEGEKEISNPSTGEKR